MEDSISSTPHILLFPFMSKGHTIPLLHLIKLLHQHRALATFTVFTTTANHSFISSSLSFLPSHLLSIISFPFPINPNLPRGIESTDQLPSMSLFPAFIDAVESLQPCFETALHEHINHMSLVLISDGFLHWTKLSASKFGIPRLVFYGMSGYVNTICAVVMHNKTLLGPEANDEPVEVPDFPWIRITRNDFDKPFNDRELKPSPELDFIVKCGRAVSKSYGLVINSFYELESKFLDYFNSRFGPKAWPIGPFCSVEKPKYEASDKPNWLEWLDRKHEENKPVLYIAFGSQAEIPDEQLKEIVTGLERSEVDFLWALRVKPNQAAIMDGLEERVKDRGLVLKGWAQQIEILAHESIQGFLSHCGWNSLTESICAGVPILAWPMMAEQHLNARMVVEEIKVGLRVETCDGLVRGFVKESGLSKMIKELIEGAKGKEVRKRVIDISMDAKKAVEEGGSSWLNLESLLNELEVTRKIDK